MNLKSNPSRFIALAFAAIATLGFATSNAAFAAARTSGGTTATGATGGACTVTEGKNKGKTGTYTVEEGTGSTWCEGSWGGTECTGGRCQSAAKSFGTVPILNPKTMVFTR